MNNLQLKYKDKHFLRGVGLGHDLILLVSVVRRYARRRLVRAKSSFLSLRFAKNGIKYF
jgi:hypothetical protein